LGDVVAIGDWAWISLVSKDEGMIEAIEPRQRMISRLDPTPKGVYQQVIIANPDQAVFVFACTRPDPHWGMLDRFLIIAEKQGIPAVIVANKIDLVGPECARDQFDRYQKIGYPVLYTSIHQILGLNDLQRLLAGKISVFTGPSGAGKSSLLNAIQPGLGLLVREVSKATLKGRHTTAVRQLFRLDSGGYVADTPGLKSVGLWDIEPEEIDGYFPELRALVDQCLFSDCTHIHEPGCAVRAAVGRGEIHPERYHSYLQIRAVESEIC
jgi:ribosome biogenesis GTPase